MIRSLAIAALGLAPALAAAQTNVPAIQPDGAPQATVMLAQAGNVSSPSDAKGGAMPAGMPPALPLLSPSAALNSKERVATGLASKWANARYMPHADADGVIRFPFGATLPTVVCAPLQVCDLALQPGEIVNNVNVGDKVRWSIMPGISGSPAGTVTHLIIKPTDAGLVSSMTILTNRRSYAVKLSSTQRQWMPLTAFSYPEDQQAQWSAYQQTVAAGAASGRFSTAAVKANLVFYSISCRGNPSWKPLRAWTDGTHTTVELPNAITTDAPALVGLANDEGWFSQATTQVVNYRPIGNRLVADGVFTRAALVSGVGSDRQECTMTREKS